MFRGGKSPGKGQPIGLGRDVIGPYRRPGQALAAHAWKALDRFTARTILLLLLAESLLIALIGGALGCGAAYIVFKIFTVGSLAAGPLTEVRISPLIFAETLVVATLIGALSALVPAYSAVRRNIVDALRMVA